jgi:hypothetical protein
VAPGSATALADALQKTIDGWDVRVVAANDDAHTAEARHNAGGYRVRIAEIVRAVSTADSPRSRGRSGQSLARAGSLRAG